MVWFIVWASLLMLGLGVNLAKHGEPETGKYNFFLRAVLLSLSIWLMYMWGAFDTLFGA
jgi:hypothetical protein